MKKLFFITAASSWDRIEANSKEEAIEKVFEYLREMSQGDLLDEFQFEAEEMKS